MPSFLFLCTHSATGTGIKKGRVLNLLSESSIKLDRGYRAPQQGDRYYLLMIPNSVSLSCMEYPVTKRALQFSN